MRHISILFYMLSFFNVSLLCAQDALNVELFGLVNRGDERYSGSWAYIAPDGSEYALVGAKTGTAIYPIDDPGNIVEVGFVPGPETNWREITVIGEHAYVSTDVMDSGHSMQVIDLSQLPDTVSLVTSYTETFTEGHIIQKDIFSDAPYVYVIGTCGSCGVHILDVSDPASPVEIGYYDPGYYIHDAHIRGDVMYAAAFYENEMDIVDISDKTNPTLIGKITYDGSRTHSSSLSMDGRILYIADENDGNPMHVFNVEDIENPVDLMHYTANSVSLVHNPYVRGNFCFISHNTEGLRVLDIADPELPVEVGYFDTYSGPSGGFSGLWSACPYFPSGKIIGGDRHEGLYIWEFNNTRAARVYGVVRDSLTCDSIGLATLKIQNFTGSFDDEFLADFNGNYKYGALAGGYEIVASAPGYQPGDVQMTLEEGDSVWVEFKLLPEDYSPTFEAPLDVPEVAIFPNPASAHFSVDLENIPSPSELTVFDETGRMVFSQKIENQSIVRVEKDFPKGKYVVKITDERGGTVGRGSVLVQ